MGLNMNRRHQRARVRKLEMKEASNLDIQEVSSLPSVGQLGVLYVYNGGFWMWNGSSYDEVSFTKPQLSNTVYIDYDQTVNDTQGRIFKTQAEAIIWINANGSPSATNQWQMILPGGLIDAEDTIVYENIRIEGNDATIVDVLKSDVTFTGATDLFKAYVGTLQINDLQLEAGKVLYIANSVIMDVTAAAATNYLALKDCSIFGGNFTNYNFPLGIFNTEFTALSAISNLTGNLSYCSFNSDAISGSIRALYSNIYLNDNITGDIYFSSLINSSDVTLTGDLLLSNVKAANPFTITIGAGNTLTTENIDDNITVIEGGGTWVNKGGKYNPSYTSLAATEFQGAIDKLWDYINLSITGLMDFKGGYNASTNTPDLDTAPSGILKGDYYVVTAAGDFFTEHVEVGDSLFAEQDNPTTLDHWVRVQKNILPKLIEIAYSELKTLCDTNLLVPGQQYRITDYEFTTTQADTQSAGNVFDIIVTADSVNTLNENARAIQHEGDTYFNDANLKAWQLKYSLDNDDTKFAWADTVNGKGVIWQMIDEWNNDLPYDFKNAQFYRAAADVSYIDVDGYYYTFAYLYDGSFVDFSIRGNFDLTEDDYDEKGIFCHNNKIGLYQKSNGTNYFLALNNIVIYNNQEFFMEGIYSNIFGDNCYDSTIADFFYNNTIGNSFYNNTIGNSFYSNTIGDNFNSNTTGNSFYNNTIGNGFVNNTIGNGFINNTIGDNFNSNTIGNYVTNNTIGNDFKYNTIGNSLFKTIFGDNCQYNTISNKINGTTSNKIITFGDSITMCTIQDYAFGALAADLDLSAATHIRGAYNTTIYQDATQGVKLSYMDGGSIIIVDVTD